MHTRRLTNILFVASLAVVLLAIFGTQLTGSSEPALSDEPQVRVEGPVLPALSGAEGSDGPQVRVEEPALSSTPNPTITPQRLKGTIPPGGVYRFTPVPIAGTPEPNPTLTLQIAILDADTGLAVQADILINDVLARSGVDRVEIRLPGRTDGITITVHADGYVPWGQGLRYKLDHSRVLYLQAELTPMAIQSGALPTLTNLPFRPTLTPTGAQAAIALASPVPALLTDTPVPVAALAPPVSPLSTSTPPRSPLPTPSPTHTPIPTSAPTPSPSVPSVVPSVGSWWSWPCNTPRQEWPDGCDDTADVAPPDHPIAPPCIRTAYTRTVPNDDYPELLDIELTVVVDHPEHPTYTPHRDAQFVRLVLQPAYGGWYADHWQLQDPDWWFKCGIDEAPLAWAVTEALNTGSLAPFGAAYDAPLPAPFVDLLAGLIADLIDFEEPPPAPTDTPIPTTTLTPKPTVDSPLPTPTP